MSTAPRPAVCGELWRSANSVRGRGRPPYIGLGESAVPQLRGPARQVMGNPARYIRKRSGLPDSYSAILALSACVIACASAVPAMRSIARCTVWIASGNRPSSA